MNKKESVNEAKKYIDIIDEMLFDDDYDFASNTLEGIKKWVEKYGTITDAQKVAVENIRAGAMRHNDALGESEEW